MAIFNVQAKQFGRTMEAGVVEAPNRKSAIEKFKRTRYVSHGYVITAQKVYEKKKR